MVDDRFGKVKKRKFNTGNERNKKTIRKLENFSEKQIVIIILFSSEIIIKFNHSHVFSSLTIIIIIILLCFQKFTTGNFFFITWNEIEIDDEIGKFQFQSLSNGGKKNKWKSLWRNLSLPPYSHLPPQKKKESRISVSFIIDRKVFKNNFETK